MLGLLENMDVGTGIPTLWLILGFTGQALFGSRFLVQWILTERARRVVVPTVFWYLSLGGGLMLLAYAILRSDPVIIVGQAVGTVVYARNLYFRKLEMKEGAA